MSIRSMCIMSTFTSVALAAASVLVGSSAVAGEKPLEEIVLLEPKNGATVSLLKDGHKEWMQMPRDERLRKFSDMRGYRKHMGKVGTHPRKVRLAWKCEHPEGKACPGVYSVEVMKRRDGRCHLLKENIKTNMLDVVNLEVGEEYTWCVWCGKRANGARFFTENEAPRWLRWHDVGNVRDLGGWKTKEGYRVRQGMAYRSQGLNDNALTFLTTKETMELHKAGQLEALFGEKGREIAALIESGKLEKDDSRLRKSLKRDKFEKGRIRGTPESREYVRTFFGIRTDIDLRRPESECWGMDGSPLGPKVDWYNYPGTAYGGMASPEGKRQFKKSFDLFLDPSKYGIVFHCIGGADRTGSMAFIINGLLGVEEDDLWKDWELTGFAGQGGYFRHEKTFNKLLKVFDAYPGETINEKIVAYVKDAGVTDEDIAKLRDILLDKGGKPVDLRGLPKWHEPSGIGNMRDLGGWCGLDGRKLRTGKVFRSAALESVKPEGREYMVRKLGIKTDLDLRTPDNYERLKGKSPLGDGVKLVNRSAPAYEGFASASGRKYFADVFRWFINEAEYPVVFHCAKGADRTGSVAFLLNGLLGVAEPDLRYDWELTQNYNSNPLFKHRSRYNRLVKMIEKEEGASFAEKMVSYARGCGITDDEIAKWRKMMIED